MPSSKWAEVEERDYLSNEAEKRGVTTRVLRERILGVVVHDRLVTAILDDAPATENQNA